jgi:hypothetical protein
MTKLVVTLLGIQGMEKWRDALVSFTRKHSQLCVNFSRCCRGRIVAVFFLIFVVESVNLVVFSFINWYGLVLINIISDGMLKTLV